MAATTRISNKDDELQKILKGDFDAPADSRRKFIPAFRAEIQTCFDALSEFDDEIPVAEGDRRAASLRFQTAFDEGTEWIRTVHRRIGGLSPKVEKAPIYAAFGFVAGRVGRLDEPDVINKLRLLPAASKAQSGAAKLAPDELAECAALLEILDENENEAGVGERSAKVRARQEQIKIADDLISRVLGWLTYALKDRDFDPLMNDYGYTPRQKPTRSKEVAPVPAPVPTP